MMSCSWTWRNSTLDWPWGAGSIKQSSLGIPIRQKVVNSKRRQFILRAWRVTLTGKQAPLGFRGTYEDEFRDDRSGQSFHDSSQSWCTGSPQLLCLLNSIWLLRSLSWFRKFFFWSKAYLVLRDITESDFLSLNWENFKVLKTKHKQKIE